MIIKRHTKSRSGSTLIFIICVVATLVFSCQPVQKQDEPQPPFWQDIQAFKQLDGVSPPPANAILFIGSSSFTLWTDVQDYFPRHKIINRGFGSSTLADQIRYVNDIVIPYKPRQVVIYCGENDIAFSDTVNAAIVFDRFKTLFGMIRKEYDHLPIIYISMKPSPSRRVLIPEMREANRLIREFIELEPNAVYIDVHSQMLDASGGPRSDIFIDDSLHLNAKGYALWQKAIEPHLLNE